MVKTRTTSARQRRLWKPFLVSSYLRYIPYSWKIPPLPSTKSASIVPVPLTAHPSCLWDVVKKLPRTQRRLLDGLEQISTDDKILKLFWSKAKLHVASDGGLHNNSATHGLLLSISGKDILYRKFGPVDCPLTLRPQQGVNWAAALLLNFFSLLFRSSGVHDTDAHSNGIQIAAPPSAESIASLGVGANVVACRLM